MTRMREFLKFVFFKTGDNLANAIALVCWVMALWVVLAVNATLAMASERDYQEAWCGAQGGEVEVILRDRTRVDCVVDMDGVAYAIEFDFAKKWAESIGQALYYGRMMKREPGIVLIVEDFDKDAKYIDRVTYATQGLGVRLWLTN